MTATIDNFRSDIISKIKELPAEKLSLVDTYLDSIAAKQTKKAAILSYAGIFKDLDDELLNSLTADLHKERISQTAESLKIEKGTN